MTGEVVLIVAGGGRWPRSLRPTESPAAFNQPYVHPPAWLEQSESTVRRERPAAAGIGFLAAGVIFGASAALGDLAVRRLLHHMGKRAPFHHNRGSI